VGVQALVDTEALLTQKLHQIPDGTHFEVDLIKPLT
jgi:hypothetical protein